MTIQNCVKNQLEIDLHCL